MSAGVIELFTAPTFCEDVDWQQTVAAQYCPYIEKKCVKIRKSQPEIAIGTCSVNYGARTNRDIIICPQRF